MKNVFVILLSRLKRNHFLVHNVGKILLKGKLTIEKNIFT